MIDEEEILKAKRYSDTNEPFSAKKFFTGFINPSLLRKVLPLMWWGALVILFVVAVLWLGVSVRRALFPPAPAVPAAHIESAGGPVTTNAATTKKTFQLFDGLVKLGACSDK